MIDTDPAIGAPTPLTPSELRLLDAYWRAANYLSVGQIYLLDNPLLREPLRTEHVKPRLLGHWGTTPGPELHLRAHEPGDPRARPERDLRHRSRPRRPGLVANAYLEGTYSEVYPHIDHDEEGLRRLFRQFSFPGGIPSHVAPETPGSIHEGGELGYALVARLRRRVRQPRPAGLLRRRRRRGGDRPAGSQLALEQVPEPRPRRRGAADPAPQRLQDRQPDGAGADPRRRSCSSLLEGYGYAPHFVAGDDPQAMHQLMAADARRRSSTEIARDPAAAREDRRRQPPAGRAGR